MNGSLVRLLYYTSAGALAALWKYFNLIIWQTYKKRSIRWRACCIHWAISFVLRSNFFVIVFLHTLLSFTIYCVLEGCTFFRIVSTKTSYFSHQSFPLCVRLHTTIYCFQCFNDVKLWIYCVYTVCMDVGNGIGKSNSAKR